MQYIHNKFLKTHFKLKNVCIGQLYYVSVCVF